MKEKFEDPFNGWGKKAAAFSIAFAFILPNYFFMTVSFKLVLIQYV